MRVHPRWGPLDRALGLRAMPCADGATPGGGPRRRTCPPVGPCPLPRPAGLAAAPRRRRRPPLRGATKSSFRRFRWSCGRRIVRCALCPLRGGTSDSVSHPTRYARGARLIGHADRPRSSLTRSARWPRSGSPSGLLPRSRGRRRRRGARSGRCFRCRSAPNFFVKKPRKNQGTPCGSSPKRPCSSVLRQCKKPHWLRAIPRYARACRQQF